MDYHNRKMNILWLADHLGYHGKVMHGAAKYYFNTIPLFDRSKFNVVLCVLRPKDSLTKHFQDTRIRIYHLGRGKFDPLTLFYLIRLIRKHNITLIHAHGYGATNFGRIAGTMFRIPTIVHAHDDDRNYPWYQELADFLLTGCNHKAIAVSQSVKNSCVTKRRMKERKVFVIHNGISLNDFNSPNDNLVQKRRKSFGIKSSSKVVGTVAKLREEKGTQYLLESAPKVLETFPNTMFLIVGDGPLRKELERLSRKLGIEKRIVFAGFCHDIPNILPIFDLAVIPSLTEGSSLALLEEMAAGKAIIATNAGGIKEVLKNGKTALLVPPKDSDKLAEKIIYLLGNKNERKRLGLMAKKESYKYDVNLHIRKLEEHYLKLLT